MTVAAPSKAWTVFAHSNAGIMGPNPTQGMDICVHLFSVFVVLCVRNGLATGWSLIQGVLPTVYKIKKVGRPNKGLYSHNNNNTYGSACYTYAYQH
jgi:hypothetical protein